MTDRHKGSRCRGDGWQMKDYEPKHFHIATQKLMNHHWVHNDQNRMYWCDCCRAMRIRGRMKYNIAARRYDLTQKGRLK